MINIVYENISPTPGYPVGVTPSSISGFNWDSRSKKVIKFKDHIKESLRVLQSGRCCFCRRHLFDDNTVDIEHFLEKSATPLHFEPLNLALSCKTCNENKNSRYISLSKRLSERASRPPKLKIKIQQCVGLLGAYDPKLPIQNQKYRWVHPHFDTYSNHIDIHKSWIYVWKTPKGRKTIQSLKLNLIGQIERRSTQEKLANKTGISLLIAGLAEADNFKTLEIIGMVLDELRK